jgi:uncharacterized protein (DUF952 family)
MILYHITTKLEWQTALQKGQYLPQDYDKDGFIHTSFRGQVVKTAARFYAGKSGLVLLKIDSSKIFHPVKVENLDGGAEKFPHIYGPLPVEAVIMLADFAPASDGRFIFPSALEE